MDALYNDFGNFRIDEEEQDLFGDPSQELGIGITNAKKMQMKQKSHQPMIPKKLDSELIN